jgi:hypothetical protein
MGRGRLPGAALALLLTTACAATPDEPDRTDQTSHTSQTPASGQTSSSGPASGLTGRYRPVDDPAALCGALDFSPLVGDTGGAAPTAEPRPTGAGDKPGDNVTCARTGDLGQLRLFVSIYDDVDSAGERFTHRGESLPGLGDDAWVGIPARAGGRGPEVHARFANATVRAVLFFDPVPGGSYEDYRESHDRLAHIVRAVEQRLSKRS